MAENVELRKREFEVLDEILADAIHYFMVDDIRDLADETIAIREKMNALKIQKHSVRFVTMRCSVCGANVYDDGTSDCDCDAHDHGRNVSGGGD